MRSKLNDFCYLVWGGEGFKTEDGSKGYHE